MPSCSGQRSPTRTFDRRSCPRATACGAPRRFRHPRGQEPLRSRHHGPRRERAARPPRHRRSRSPVPTRRRRSMPGQLLVQILGGLCESDRPPTTLLDLLQHLVDRGLLGQAPQFADQVLLKRLPAPLSATLKRRMDIVRNIANSDGREIARRERSGTGDYATPMTPAARRSSSRSPCERSCRP
jgi:hypothetical protein